MYKRQYGMMACYSSLGKSSSRIATSIWLLAVSYTHLDVYKRQERTFCVRVGDLVSSERRITASVPQGSVLGPLLFSNYVNDVPRQPGVQMALFADDTAVFTADRHVERAVLRLQRQLDTLGAVSYTHLGYKSICII